jgi:ribosomal protein L24E
MTGLGSFTISTSAPLQPGQVYHNPILTVTAGGQTCGEFQTVAGGYTSDLEMDQFVFSQGNIETFAAQFSCVNANVGIFATIAYKMANSTPHQGYYLFDRFGDTANFGNDGYLNYLAGPSYFALNQPILGMTTTPDGAGYWMTAADGGVFALGDAGFYGSTGNIRLAKPVVGMAATPDGKGYWLVASDGGIFAFGDAHFYGSTGNIRLAKPVVGMAATPDGKGYWLVASDGGIFAFGDAHFYGSTGGLRLERPVTGMLPSADGHGYLLVASDGGIFAFGDAQFRGSLGGQGVTGIVGLVR